MTQERWLIRSMNPNAYKSGEWAEIVGRSEVNGRECYEVLFPDGSVDTWVAGDRAAEYQFSRLIGTRI